MEAGKKVFRKNFVLHLIFIINHLFVVQIKTVCDTKYGRRLAIKG